MRISGHRSHPGCGSAAHYHRRSALKFLGLSGLAWLTPVGTMRAELANHSAKAQAESLILLWLDGGPSQLETFDPHPLSKISQGTKAITTAKNDIKIAAGLEQVAEHFDCISVVRNVITKEGDHERANYNVKTGFRPDPTIVHPSIGAVLAHQLPTAQTEIPRHISILPAAWPGRGGYLGDAYDAFKTGDPGQPIPDLGRRVSNARFQQRLENLSVVDRAFGRGRLSNLESKRTLHRTTIDQAVAMMDSEQLKAFDLATVPKSDRLRFGDTSFGRGCLAAARLTEVGVRCVEVTLGGWDLAHASNHSVHRNLVEILDAAFAGLIEHLKQRDRLRNTIVMCCGEFGRTPQVNAAGGRDHWPHGFSVAIAGGGIAGGRLVGSTDPEGSRLEAHQGTPIEDIHATVMHQMGVQYARELATPVNRPMRLSEGEKINKLLA